MKNHNFRDLNAWKESMELCISIYEITRKLPEREKFVLISQMNRSAISIPSNIAEGLSRKSIKEQNKFLDYSLGSSYELESQMIITNRIYPQLVSPSHFKHLLKVQNYIGAFKRKINQPDKS